MSIIEIPRPTPARRVHALPPTDERLVWKSTKSDALLDHGNPMTIAEALDYARTGAANSRDYRVVSATCLRWTSGFGSKCEFAGTLPVPADPHAAVDALQEAILDLPLTIRQGDPLIAALRAAIDGTDPVPALLQLLATTAIRP